MADNNVVTKDLGPVSAYAIAVKHGYQGTEEEWAALQIAAADNAKAADDAAKEAAATLAAAHETVTQETNQAVETINAREMAAIEAVGAKETASIQAVQEAASVAGAAQEQAIAAKGAETLESIPKDYTELTKHVTALTAEMAIQAPAIIPTATGEVVTVNDSAKRPFAGLRLYGKTTQDGTPTPDNPVPLVSVGDVGNIGVNVRGKNLLTNAAVNKTVSGVAFTVNADGSITANGTATGDIWYNINTKNALPVGSYIMNGCKSNAAGYYLVDYVHKPNGEYIRAFVDTGLAVTVEVPDATWQHGYQIYIPSGTVMSDVIFRPMLRPASIVDDTYEPYADGGSVTALTPNGLPGIPVSSGGNYTDSTGQQWVCDEIDLGRGVYIQRINRLHIDNMNNIVVGISSGGVPYADVYIGTQAYDVDSVAFSTHYKQIGQNAPGYHGTFKRSTYALTVYDNRFMDADTATALLSEMGFEAYSVLRLPIETPLSAEELTAYRAMTSQYPSTTVYNDAGAGMAVQYIADTKTYIDKKIAAIAAATV